jgi:hypothetical protein
MRGASGADHNHDSLQREVLDVDMLHGVLLILSDNIAHFPPGQLVRSSRTRTPTARALLPVRLLPLLLSLWRFAYSRAAVWMCAMQRNPLFVHLTDVDDQVVPELMPPLFGVHDLYRALDGLWALTPAPAADSSYYPATLLVPGTMLSWGKTLHVLARATFEDAAEEVDKVGSEVTRLQKEVEGVKVRLDKLKGKMATESYATERAADMQV